MVGAVLRIVGYLPVSQASLPTDASNPPTPAPLVTTNPKRLQTLPSISEKPTHPLSRTTGIEKGRKISYSCELRFN